MGLATAGIIYAINLVMAFHWGAVLEYDYQEIEVTDGLEVAKYYTR